MGSTPKFEWDEERTKYLVECFETCTGNGGTVKIIQVALRKMFIAKYPECKLKPATLYSAAKKAVDLQPIHKGPPPETWDDEMDEFLNGCAKSAYEQNKKNPRRASAYYELAIGKFTERYKEISEHAIKTRMERNFLRLKDLEQLEAASKRISSGGEMEVDKPAEEKRVKFDKEFLMEAVKKAIDQITSDKQLGLNEGKTCTKTNYIALIHKNYKARYPETTERQIKYQLKAEKIKMTDIKFDEPPIDYQDHFATVMRYWEMGHKLSQLPIYSATCANCSAFISKGPGQYPDTITARSYHPKILDIYDEAHILQPIQHKKNGAYFKCGNCGGKKDLLGTYPLGAKDDKNWPVPNTLQGLSKQEKAQISLIALSCRIAKHNNPGLGTFEHQIGQTSAHQKNAKAYFNMYSMMFEKEPDVNNPMGAAVRIMSAIRTLKKINPLYKTFHANYETLLRYKTNAPGTLGSVLVMDEFEINPVQKDVTLRDTQRDDPYSLIIPAEDLGTRGVDSLQDIETGTQHPTLHEVKTNFWKQTRVTYYDKELEQKLFPDLFPYGVGGHRNEENNLLAYGSYLKWRIQMHDDRFRRNIGYLFYSLNHLIKERLQGYSSCRVDVSKLQNPVKKKDVKTELRMEDDSDPDSRYGREVPHTLPNSRNFFASKTQDLLAFGETMGDQPDFLVTLTQNDSWPEIRTLIDEGPGKSWTPGREKEFCELLFHKVNATEYPVEVALAFYKRLQAFQDEFLNNKVSPLGIIKDYWLRIEYQGRGGLHAHIVIWCEKGTIPEQALTAEMPRFEHPFNDIWRRWVNTLEKHKCRDNCFRWESKDPKKTKSKKCKYGFPAEKNIVEGLDPKGSRYLYRRRKKEDCDVVPYNLPLLLFWGAHCNVERVTRCGWELYVAKYVAKCDKSQKIQCRKRYNKSNNVSVYLNSRMCGSIEAASLLLSKPQVKCSREIIFLPHEITPKVRFVKKKCHLTRVQDESTDIYYDTKLEKYLDRPPELLHLTYPQFYQRWYLAKAEPNKSIWGEVEIDDVVEEEQSPGKTSRILTDMVGRKWRERHQGHKSAVVRFRYFLPYGTQLEDYCLVKLLKSIPVDWAIIEEWKKPGFTYLKECLDRGLIKKEEEALQFLSSAARRGFDAEHIREIARTLIEGNWLKEQDIDGLLETVAPGHLEVEENIQRFIADQEYEDVTDLLVQDEYKTQEEYVDSFSDTQRRGYNYITDKWQDEKQALVFVTGEAGSGKTYLLDALYVYCQNTERTVQKLATTGSAALKIGGLTCHSWLQCNTQLESHIEPRTAAAYILKSCTTIMIDEVSMLEDHMLTRLEALLQEFTGNGALYAGKSIILFGDPAQLEAIDGNIWQRRFFSKFDVMVIRQSQRQKGDQRFCQLLNRVRIGEPTKEDIELLRSRVRTPEEIEEMQLTDAMTLVPTRKLRDQINLRELDKLEGEEKVFVAEDVDVGNHKLTPGNQKYVYECEKHYNLLPREIKLKVGAKVILTRNKSIATGWVNGTMATVDSYGEDHIILRSKADPRSRFVVSRVKEAVQPPNSNAVSRYFRKQFCVELAYASTIHKAQGLTVFIVIGYADALTASGQFYTLISRAPSLEQLFFASFNPESIFIRDDFKALLRWMDEVDVLRFPAPIWMHKPQMPHVSSHSRPIGAVIRKNLESGELPPADNVRRKKESFDEACLKLLDQVEKMDTTGCFKIPTTPGKPQKTPTKRTKSPVRKIPTPEKQPRTSDAEDSHRERRSAITLALESLDQIPVHLQVNTYLRYATHALSILPGLFDQVQKIVVEQLPNIPIIYNNQSVDQRRQPLLPRAMQQHHRVIETSGDGNCLFRAMSLTIFGHENYHLELRFLCACVFIQHSATFLENAALLDQDVLQILIKDTCRMGVWGTHNHLKAIALLTNRQVWSYVPFAEGDPRNELDREQLIAQFASNTVSYSPNVTTPYDVTHPLMVLLTGSGPTAHFSAIYPTEPPFVFFPPRARGDVLVQDVLVEGDRRGDGITVVDLEPSTPIVETVQQKLGNLSVADKE